MQQDFRLPVIPLVGCLGSVGAAVQLKVKLSLPLSKSVVIHMIVDTPEIILRCRQLYLGYAGNIFHNAALL